MTGKSEHIDEFESIFKRAEREQFAFAEIPISKATIVIDGASSSAEELKRQVLQFIPRFETIESWRVFAENDYSNVNDLLEKIDEDQTDLLVTYRLLHAKSFVPQHSLGLYLDVLTQKTSIPVLVLPGTAAKPISLVGKNCNRVMVVTDHISGDNRLVNYGVRLCTLGGSVWLCHTEDEAALDRFMDAIAKIPEIETDSARELIEGQLLKEARDFIEICIAALQEHGPNLSFHERVRKGHHLREYRQLIDEHEIDLLVANTKDEGQLAMHGMTYSISVELTDTAMLLL